MASLDLVDDLLQAYLAQYDHFPRTPEQLCTFAKNQGRPLRYSSARSAWSTGRASREAARESRAASSHEGLSISTVPSLSSTASSSSTGQESTLDSQASSSEAGVTRPWLERYQEHHGHHPTSPQHLLAFVNNRGGSITYTTALRLMGQAGNVPPEPPPRIPVMMRLERASATGPLPWWQDTLAINRHYRRLTRMIFTTLVTESNDASDSDVAAQVSLDLARRLLQLASPVSAQEGSSCAICLDKSDANEAPWVQLPCEHVLHRKCFQELVSHNLFQCRCPLCRCDLVQRLLQE